VLRAIGVTPVFRSPGEPHIYRDGRFELFPRGPIGFFRTTALNPQSRMQMLRMFMRMMTRQASSYGDMSLAQTLERHNPSPEVVEMVELFSLSALACVDISKASAKEAKRFLLGALPAAFEPLDTCAAGGRRSTMPRRRSSGAGATS